MIRFFVFAIRREVLESVANWGLLMLITSKINSWILILVTIAITLPAARGARPFQQAENTESNVDIPDEAADDELAPAAVQLDTANLSPLLLELYQATRETKEQEVLTRLAHVKE